MATIKRRSDGVVQRYHEKHKFQVATIRVVAKNEEDQDQAYEYEFDVNQDMIISRILAKLRSNGTLKDSKYIGNGYSLEATKSAIQEFYDRVRYEIQLPSKFTFAIEWDYWIED